MGTKEIRLVSTAGIIGYGFPEDSLKRAMERKPHVIGCDAGSTDRGPGDLGNGTVGQSRETCKRDLLLMLRAARDAKIPMIVGSCGGSGGDPHLRAFEEIVREIAPQGQAPTDAAFCVLMNLAVIGQFSSEDVHVLRRNIWPFRNTVRKTEDDCKHG